MHFGFDAIAPEGLREVVDELKRHNKPLVYTVHDLRNPHHPERTAHDEQQDVLVAAATTLITLTPGAARAVSERWGRKALILPHPHVLDSARIGRPRPRRGPFVVAMHAKSVRANMDPLTVLDALVPIVAELPGAILQLDLHDEIFHSDNHWYAPELGTALQKSMLSMTTSRYGCTRTSLTTSYGTTFPRIRSQCCHTASAPTPGWLEACFDLGTAAVVPRFGTHSRWLEACFDLGTAVIAPSCGYYHEQRPCGVFDFAEDRFDVASLHRAVRAAYRRWRAGVSAPRASWAQRRTERVRLAEAHRRLYECTLS